MASITRGAVARIVKNDHQGDFHPTLQVLSVKKMNAPGTNDRFRLILSDGAQYQQSMLATQQNHLVSSEQLQDGCLIRMKEFIVNDVQGKRLIIVLSLDVESAPMDKIGNPVAHGENGSENRAPAPTHNKGGQGMATGPYGQGNTGGGGQSNGPYGKPPSKPYGGGGDAGGSGYGGARPQGGRAPNPYGGGGGGGRGGGGGGYSNPYQNSGGQMGGQRGPVQREEFGEHYVPIQMLNPYQNKWTIKCRVTQKSDIRRWSNARGEGHLFSVDLLDEAKSEIRATFFKEACDKFYEMLQQGEVYTFSGGKVKVANKQFTSCSCDYELTFDLQSLIQHVPNDNRIRQMTFNFHKISEVEAMEPNTMVDVIGVVSDVSDMVTINTRAGKELEKRNLTLVDDTMSEIQVTLWGSFAKDADQKLQGQPIVGLKGAKVSDFNGCSLGTVGSTTLAVDPPVPEAQELQAWWANAGRSSTFKSVSTGGGGGGGGGGKDAGKTNVLARHTVAWLNAQPKNAADNPIYISIQGTIGFIKHDNDPGPWYTACPSEGCNKKVTETYEGGWQCEKCNKLTPNCERRYILTCSAQDQTGSTYIKGFNEAALTLLGGRTADELNSWKENGQEASFEEVFTEALFKTYNMRLRLKTDVHQDEARLNASIVGISLVDPVTEGNALLDAISKYD